MDFIIKYDQKNQRGFDFKYCNSLDSFELKPNIAYIEKLNHLDYIELTINNLTQIAIGDVIKTLHSDKDLTKSKGLFYLISIDNLTSSLVVTADEHSLLPIYYLCQDGYYFISSSFRTLVHLLKGGTQNKFFYPELALLYTQLNGSTFYNEIYRLDYGQLVELSTEFKVITTKRFYDYFTSEPKSYKSSINSIANKFIETSKSYLNEPCAISLTGGFDGRTITGCAHFHKTEFINFSYGRRSNGDVENPIEIAKKLNLDYHLIELEKDYLSNDYLSSVNTYLKYSGGLNGFQYPQSIYYVKEIANQRTIIVTGYLGSEILASVKGSDDEVSPKIVIDYLSNENNFDNYAFSQIPILQNLNILESGEAIKRVIDIMVVYFKSLPNDLTTNQKFVVFAFENIYRNTFGPWIYNGMHFAKIRVPFLDKDFFNEICKTEVSQFYRSFLETNPIKRLKGQMLYSRILKKTWTQLNNLTSSKGYAPADILTLYGRVKIALDRILKSNKYVEQHGLDKMSTLSGAIDYLKNKQNKMKDNQVFDMEFFVQSMKEGSIKRSLCFLSLSKLEFENILNLANNINPKNQ